MFTLNGHAVDTEEGITVAAALMNAGITRFRESVNGTPRGPLCAMGICHECRVVIDGATHQRSCLVPVAHGMQVSTADAPASPRAADSYAVRRVGVAVIGAGPAGIAAACRAAEGGADVLLIDEAARPGGQIWRHRAGAPTHSEARRWMARLQGLPADHVAGATVTSVMHSPDGHALTIVTQTATMTVHAKAVVIATGARERFLPFPGSTLPNVIGVGAAQALLKSGWSVRGKRVVIAGTGALLLPVAAAVAKGGAQLLLVAEQASRASVVRFAAGLWRHPGSLADAARYRGAFAGTSYAFGAWVQQARGDDRVRDVDVMTGGGRRTYECDVLCVAHGLVSNTEIARLMGCDVKGGSVVVDAQQQTTVEGIFAAGEVTGVGGAALAIAEGERAGLAAVGLPSGSRLQRRASALRHEAERMARAFALRAELRGLASGREIVCRCEDVTMQEINSAWTTRQSKLYSRAGMGACQGRVCGPALEFLCGQPAGAVRIPIQPTTVASLAGAGVHDSSEPDNG